MPRVDMIEVEVEGYGPFREACTYPLASRGAVLVRGETDASGSSSNGAGKSLLMFASWWALTGETDPRPMGSSRKGMTSEVVHDGSDRARVRLSMMIDGVPVIVERSMGSGGHRLMVEINGKDRTEQEIKLTQSVIDATIPIQALRRIAYLSQHSGGGLLDMTDSDRKKLLSEIIDLDVWQRAAEVSKNRAAESRREADRLSGMVAGAALSRDQAESGLERAKADHEAWSMEHATACETAGREMIDVASKKYVVSDITDQDISHFNERLTPQVRPMATSKVPEMTAAADRLRWKLEELERQQTGLAQDGAKIKSRGQALAAGGGRYTCGECRQPVALEASELQRRLNAARDDLECTRRHWRDVTHRMKALQAEIDLAQREISTVKREEQSARARHTDEIRRAEIASRGARIAIDKVRAYRDLMKKSSPHAVSIQAFEEMLSATGTDDIEAQQADAQRSADTNAELSRVMGRSGIQSALMDEAIADLGNRISEALSEVSGGSLRMTMSGQTETKSGKVREKISFDFEVLTSSGYRPRSYRQLSGGQRRRCQVSTALALAGFVSARTGHSTNMVVLDEVLGHLDAEGKAATWGAIQKISNAETMLVVTHDSGISGSFDSVDVVRMSGGESSVDIGVDVS